MRLKLFFFAVFMLPSTLFFFSYGKVTKILTIGNSFSEDAVEQYLYELALEGGDTLLIANAFRAGQGLESHWNVVTANKPDFQYRKIVNGVKTNTPDKTLLFCIEDENWDYITFQQASPDSGLEYTYEPYLGYLLEYVKQHATNPQVTYGLHQTWAYAQNSTHNGFINYGRNQQTMYKAIVNAVNQAAEKHKEDIRFIVPSGTGIQNGRSSFIGDNLNRDGYHLNLGTGRYIAACTWLECITGQNPIGKKYRPNDISESIAEVAQYAAHYAIENPNAVTQMNQFGYEAENTVIPEAPIKINFGKTGTMATEWNNVTPSANIVTNLTDIYGKSTEIMITLNDNFTGTNTEGIAGTTTELNMPEDVAVSALWGYDEGTFGNSTKESTGGFLFSHLNKDLVYDFYLFGSRKNSTDNRETVYILQGENRKRNHLNAASNADKVTIVKGIKPTQEGKITLTVSAGPNNTNSNAFYYINALQIVGREYEDGDFSDNESTSVFYITPGGCGEQTGTDWNNAFDLTTENLKKGSAGDEFWVKAGTYTNAIVVASELQLYGGFCGTETEREQRDWAANQTVIKGNEAATVSLVTLEESATVDGFYIQDNQNCKVNGGGVTMKFKTTLRNCVVRNNSTGGDNVGGGVFVTNTAKDGILPTIENCLIHNNATPDNGGGIQVIANGQCHLIGSTVANNKITKVHGTNRSGYGCGIGLPATASIIVENSIIANNGKIKGDGNEILYLSFGANYNQSNNRKSSIFHSAYDAINNDNGANTVIFTMEDSCIDNLSTNNGPNFVKATSFIGCVPTYSTDKYEEILHADYHLDTASPCIDKGANNFVRQIKDLSAQERINNGTVDMGAYEYIPSPTTGMEALSEQVPQLYVKDQLLSITGLRAGEELHIYNALGKPVCSAQANGNTFSISLPANGLYIVKTNRHTQKIVF